MFILSSFVFLFFTYFFSFFSACFSIFTSYLAFFFSVGINPSMMPLPLTLSSSGLVASTFFYSFSFLVSFSFYPAALAWAGVSPWSLDICVPGLRVICAPLVDFFDNIFLICAADFFGNIFLTSCLLFVSATFSLPFDSFSADCSVLVYAACFLGDLVRKGSPFLGQRWQWRFLSLNVLAFFLPLCPSVLSRWNTLSAVSSNSCVSVAWIDSSDIGGDSIGFAITTLGAYCFFQTILPSIENSAIINKKGTFMCFYLWWSKDYTYNTIWAS